MKFLAVGLILLLFSSLSLADYTCVATCVNAQNVSYRAGASFTILNAYKVLDPVTRRTKRRAWRDLKKQCDPYLLVTSYETSYEFGVGRVMTSHEEAKKRTACDRAEVMRSRAIEAQSSSTLN